MKPTLTIALRRYHEAGAERVAFELGRRLAPDWDVRLVALKEHELLPPDLEGGGGMWSLLFGRTDLLFTNLFVPGVLARIRRMWDRETPWVHAVHYYDYANLRWGWLRKRLDRGWVYPAADALVAPGAAVAAELEGYRRVVNIPNAVELGERPVPRSRGGGAPVVGTVAMLRHEKGLEFLIDAAEPLAAALPGVRIRIVGDGPLEASLRRRIRDRGVESVVELCGYVDDVDAFYTSLDIYVQPSRTEAFGIAALEAFAYGIPVVVSDQGFLTTLAGEGAWGRIVPIDHRAPTRLAEALAEVWEDQETWAGRAVEGWSHWSQRLSPTAMADSYGDLFASLLPESSSRG